MKQRTDKPATSDAVHDKKARFKIEKLEERIAPRHFYKEHGQSFHKYYNNGSGGHCGHGACK